MLDQRFSKAASCSRCLVIEAADQSGRAPRGRSMRGTSSEEYGWYTARHVQKSVASFVRLSSPLAGTARNDIHVKSHMKFRGIGVPLLPIRVERYLSGG